MHLCLCFYSYIKPTKTNDFQHQNLTFLTIGIPESLPLVKLLLWCSLLICLSFTVFTALVKNIKAGKVANVKGLEAIGDD